MDLNMVQTTLVVLLLLSGLATLSTSINRKYYYVDECLSWTEAQHYCRQRFTDLATVENDDDHQKLLTSAPTFAQDTNMWIGLHDRLDWKWSLQDKSFYGDGEADFRKWHLGEPNNYNGTEGCVRIRNGDWYDGPCHQLFSVICVTANGTYVFVVESKNWTAAQTYCRTHYRDLVSIRNLQENNKVQRILPDWNAGGAWTGLYRDPWHYWSDNSTSRFTNWKDGHPPSGTSMLCAAVSSSSEKWISSGCDSKLSFFCYNIIKSRLIFKMRIHSAVDMNDEDVQHQFTQQLHTLLASQGVTSVTMRTLREDKPPSKSNSPPSACP
ncbi:macrophage mannose receptor 1-like [Thalassophryne amazonica]|uniref:macrophage mannose receptor 1-like n=1 Tax=Thalassophryne amazonica TaxID=390379 RepID=UPI0014709515|nr:macrophage mannose receptor 1-like [Thalassophryne amazonica]